MKKPLLVIGLLIAIVYACNNSPKTINRLLKPGNLNTQTFVIDIRKDTTLITQKGALIRIPQGALAADNEIVKLEVKEAYSMRDILIAGLTTQSNGQPLSSGGMIYINAVGENNVRITQKIFVATPTPSLTQDMQLFKGKVQSDSTINWTDPTPMPENPQLTALGKGKQMFTDNCASCHSITKDLTGPALGGILQRAGSSQYELDHLYEFTRNPAKVMASSIYYQCLKQKFGGAMMTSFPNLTDEDLNNIYGYINNAWKPTDTSSISNYKSCKDSCDMYFEVAYKWKKIKADLEKDSVDMIEDRRDFPADTTAPDTTYEPEELVPDPPTEKDIQYVNPAQNKSLYYQFTIESFGWYNIDILLKASTGAIESELMVRIQGQYKERFSIYLIIPSIKLMAPGGLLNNEKEVYGFAENDGSINLPQGAKAYIIAMGEYDDKIIFTKKEFTTEEKQSFNLELTTITKAALEHQLKSLQLNDVKFKVDDTKNSAELRKAIKELKSAEGLKPKNCNCDCFAPIPPETSAFMLSTGEGSASQLDY